ncbi:hypothetical protein [Roseibium sp.]|uniref:hypothetical protein n=1 Tax=Roseibium sp. TaxID=1936156 RepID=UPI003BA9A589
MNDRNRRDWIWAGSVGAALLFITIVIDNGGIPYVSETSCREPDGRSLWCHAYAWQTLIAGFLAVAGAVITVRHMRRERRMEALTRTIAGIGHAQAALFSLRTTRRSITAVHTAICNGEEMPRHTLRLLTWEGINIPQEVDPISHFIVRDAWVYIQHIYAIANQANAPTILTQDDANGLASAIQKIDETIATIEQEFIEQLASELRKRGFVVWRDENGIYRHDRTQDPRI